ncbi:MAG: MMPL family transporter [Thermodesulfobacteriota bacterium]
MTSRSIISKLLLLAVTLVGIYFSVQVKLDEDALDMLPGPALQGDFRLLQQLGMINRVFISLELESDRPDAEGLASPDLLLSARLLGENLAASPSFSDVFYRLPQGYEFHLVAGLKKYLPVLADNRDLRRFKELMTPELLREKIRQDYLDLNSLAGLAMRQQIQQDPLGFTGVVLEKLTALRGGMRLTIRDGFFVSGDGKHCLLWAESSTPLTSSANAALLSQQIEDALAVSLKDGVKARIIGPLPHTLANANTIRSDLGKLLPVAVIALVLFLLVFLRDWRALLLVAMPFFAAPPAIALLALVYGKVSAMALGFGIVLLGIGVDFAVHIYVGCRSEQSSARISKDLRKSLIMAFLTTITVFAVLLLSKVPAHRQMAYLAIVGLSWALLLAWQLIPGLAGKRGCPSGVFGARLSGASGLINHGWQLRPFKLLLWLLILAAGVASWPSLHYNGDLRTLDVPSASVKNDERVFLKTWGGDQEQAFVVAVAPEQGKVLDINDQVYEILVKEDRLAEVQSLATLLPGPIRQGKNLLRWQAFWQQRLTAFRPQLEQAAIENGFTRQAFQPFIDWLAIEPASMEPGAFLDGPLRPFINSLFRRAVEPELGSGRDEVFLVATVVPDNRQNSDVLKRINREVPGATVLSNSRWRQKVEADLKNDIHRLFSLAALLVIAICTLFFRRLRPVIGVLAPVTSSLAAMALFAALTGGELNIMHALMGIMVIGLSVDYGIFIVNSCLSGLDGRAFMAVSICAISTLSGFGVLGFATHPALHALGVTVLVGIGAAWPTALFITPLLLARPASKEMGI